MDYEIYNITTLIMCVGVYNYSIAYQGVASGVLPFLWTRTYIYGVGKERATQRIRQLKNPTCKLHVTQLTRYHPKQTLLTDNPSGHKPKNTRAKKKTLRTKTLEK